MPAIACDDVAFNPRLGRVCNQNSGVMVSHSSVAVLPRDRLSGDLYSLPPVYRTVIFCDLDLPTCMDNPRLTVEITAVADLPVNVDLKFPTFADLKFPRSRVLCGARVVRG